ncbi:hypothetical protein BGW38_010402 [Lunasporangiospora selenospora]|uniref:WW domain-containing protein n=1 Tax=Lunasporangiospora selenospora TaxID=979761 RepID=A0A9P6FX16_9FUNG|nr:hypothetical protein BGW38_010402 [Lunasporangiospora selenospora]
MGIDSGAAHPPQHQQVQPQSQQVPYGISQQTLPPSTLPEGWISQYDPSKQRLYYVYPQTGQVTWAHPLGPQADAQEMNRFYQIQKLQQQQYGSKNQHGFTDSYNRQGGMGGAVGLMAGSMMANSMMAPSFAGDIPAGYGDVPVGYDFGSGDIPASYDFGGGGGDFSGGMDF